VSPVATSHPTTEVILPLLLLVFLCVLLLALYLSPYTDPFTGNTVQGPELAVVPEVGKPAKVTVPNIYAGKVSKQSFL